jgi:hypothetical protein
VQNSTSINVLIRPTAIPLAISLIEWLIYREEIVSAMKREVGDVVVAQGETKMKPERRIVGMNGRC